MNIKVLTLLHSLIASFAFLGSVVASGRAYKTEGLLCFVLPLLILPWLVCSFGLLFRRRWAWWGSLGAVLVLYAVLGYLLMLPGAGDVYSDSFGFLTLAGLAPMVPLAIVLVLLLVGRRQILAVKS